jgi:hypothetical protein
MGNRLHETEGKRCIGSFWDRNQKTITIYGFVKENMEKEVFFMN